MPPKFGTSGLRGLVVDLTDALVADYVRAFLATCDHGGSIWVGWDLRPSSPRIADAVVRAAAIEGVAVSIAGALPTPALALAAADPRGSGGAVMVTGSHIPADRNGLKFYTRAGEITKADEAAIMSGLGRAPAKGVASGAVSADAAAGARFIERYVAAFGCRALAGRQIGVYTHSAVGRDLLLAVLKGLGAETVELARSEVFVPVDTEAVDAETRMLLGSWADAYGLDAIVSTDGDSDRPMMTDESGQVIAGDVLGQITAELLGAEAVVTPISSNSGVSQKPCFERVLRTRIGSPFVIAGMKESAGRVAGYEANGGFLLGFEAAGPAGPLTPLTTRDSFLPIIAPLVAAEGRPLSERIAAEPAVFTASDRLQDVSQEKMRVLVADMTCNSATRSRLLAACGIEEVALDLTDGVRMSDANDHVLHVRPSGNAPELRVYVEAPDRESAVQILIQGLDTLQQML